MGKANNNRNMNFCQQHNNDNPYNKLSLNKYHQIGGTEHISESKQLHKQKRDIERLIKHKQSQNEEADTSKVQELQNIESKLDRKKKVYEKTKRRQFFIKSKYKQIMEIEMRKITKKIKLLKQNSESEASKKQLNEWQMKKRYIQFYPKNLKYVSLFPSSKPLEDGAVQFQRRVMQDIEESYQKKLTMRNEYKILNNKQESYTRKIKDNFFIAEVEQE